jgi:spermidine dehydrogenase
MRNLDKKLGMDKNITRRDFVNGTLVAGAGAALMGPLSACENSQVEASFVYPPTLTGMRGNNDGSFEVAHAFAREGKTDWETIEVLEDTYDLVVVGAGISGLSAAYFYRQGNPDARILILDNHDDFGGHARRNEFEVDGRILLGNGGSDFLGIPHSFNDNVKSLLREIRVDLDRLEKTYDHDFRRRHGLGHNYHFKKDVWGKSVTVAAGPLAEFSNATDPSTTIEETIARFPVSENAKKELLYVFSLEEDQLPDLSEQEKISYLSAISYQDFLIKHFGVTEKEVFDFFQDQTSDIGLGIDATDAFVAMTYAVLPGWKATGLPDKGEFYGDAVFKFPDGNASIPRLLVRSLIPGIAPGNTMEDVVLAQFDYSKLDQQSSNIQVRLNSTVTHVVNVAEDNNVSLTYVKEGSAYGIKAKQCVLACNNAIIPYICPELPTPQKEALANQVRQPMLLTRVALKNWKAWHKLGLDQVVILGGYHTAINLPSPLNMGGYQYSQDPEEPNTLELHRFPHVKNQGFNAQEQFRAGRYELLATPFEDIERNIRTELNELLGPAGFNAADDIDAIIVNRWAHGYAYTRYFHSLFDDDYEDPNDPRYPHVHARKPMGNISIANSDAGGNAMVEEAIEQAHRAVNELML